MERKLGIQIGITERGDPALDRSWVEKLKDANIIITKNPGAIHSELLKHKNKIILHATVTGMGGTEMEPNVPRMQDAINSVCRLIDAGLPAKQVVLRIDPIIPELLTYALDAAYYGKELTMRGVKRVRFSFVDLYQHVIERFKASSEFIWLAQDPALLRNIKPLDKRSAVNLYEKALLPTFRQAGFTRFESCAENAGMLTGCVSGLDIDLLGIDAELKPTGYQRVGCLCSQSKTELLTTRAQCAHGCLYCYWKDSNKEF